VIGVSEVARTFQRKMDVEVLLAPLNSPHLASVFPAFALAASCHLAFAYSVFAQTVAAYLS
jgi:hypothetical protein